MLGEAAGSLVELPFADEDLDQRRGRPGGDGAGRRSIVGDAGEHSARGLALSRRGVCACGIQPDARAVLLPAPLRNELERLALRLAPVSAGDGTELVAQPPQRLQGRGRIGRQVVLQPIERPERITPAGTQVRLEPSRRKVVLPAQVGQKV